MSLETKNTNTLHSGSLHAQHLPEQDICIRIQNLTKIYKLYDNSIDRLKESLLPLNRKYHRDFHALNNISFEVKQGESVGIIGKNGSGKSTLLKIITGVLTSTSGNLSVNGKVSALLELGAGFDPELTGIENIYFNGAITGYTQKEIDSMLDDILSFADIGDFIYQPLKTYSTGMFLRLAFSAAINVNPDILIVDEALSVGDIFFQQKCFAAIHDIISKGTTCLFVSHDTTAVMNICNRAILLDNGEIDFDGAPEEAAGRYYSKIGTRDSSIVIEDQSEKLSNQYEDHIVMSHDDILTNNILQSGIHKRSGDRELEIVAARITNSDNLDTMNGEMLESLIFYLLLRANSDILNPTAAVQIYDRFGTLVFAAGTQQLRYSLPSLSTGELLIVKFDLTLSVQEGEYTFELIAGEPSPEGPNVGFVHDKHLNLGPIKVTFDYSKETASFYGVARLPMKAYCKKVKN